MLKPMPHKLLGIINEMRNINLEDFFGFCLAEVTTPKIIKIPLLPYKFNGKTIFPTGSWIGVYFSEELKTVSKHGYKINLIKGYEFSKLDLFTNYVNHFYLIKKNSEGAERWIAKMHLNGLYGIFGRRKDLIQTINVKIEDIDKYLSSKLVKTIIEINEDIYTVLIHKNVNKEIIKELNSKFEKNFTNLEIEVKSNVAIAAAVTSYARIHMIQIKSELAKLGIDVLYTDTDSLFTDKPLPDYLIGKELGQMKDELEGGVITKGYFLGIKKYGYEYRDVLGNTHIKSVLSGVERNSLNLNDLKYLSKGGIIEREIDTRFYKSFQDLNITIKTLNCL
jgi:hypothetical protein